MTRTRPQVALAVLALVALGAAGCVGFNNPEGWAGPAQADDLLVASTDRGELSALDGDDFSSVWTFPTGQEEPELDLEAIYGTPLVVGDTAYFGAYSGDVYALSLEDGNPQWTFDVGDPIIAGLAASETVIYAATDAGILYALDARDGSRLESFSAGDSIWGAPLFDNGVIYVASVNGKLFALKADTFDPIWDAPFETESGLISDPVLADGTVLIGGIGRKLHAVDADSGEERWSFDADNWFWGRPLVEDGVVYVPNLDGRLHALSLADGSRKWDFEAEEALRSAPVLAGGVLVIADHGGNVYGLEPTDGSLIWSKELNETVLSNPLLQAVAAENAEGANEELFISAEGGDLFRVEDPATGKVSRLDPGTGRFVDVVPP